MPRKLPAVARPNPSLVRFVEVLVPDRDASKRPDCRANARSGIRPAAYRQNYLHKHSGSVAQFDESQAHTILFGSEGAALNSA